jgi:DNA mismatch repair protein MutS2
VRNVADILSELTAPALVLFDEPGGGTDPIEGGALACGLLIHLKEHGVHVAASTHLTPVKLFALADGAYQVAAVAFDVDTLTPHYQLLYDTVGQSLGLAMARRLGLPEAVCAAADATLSAEERQLSQAIAQLEEMRVTLEREKGQIAREREEVTKLRAQQQRLLADTEDKKRRLWQDELAEVKQLVRRVREEGREVLANLRAAQPQARQQMAKFLHDHGQVITEKEQILQPETAEHFAPPQVGDAVELHNGKIRGELIAVQGTRARIRRGGMTFEVAIEQVRKSNEKQEPVPQVTVDRGSDEATAELNLLGMRVHEALPQLEEFLDRATLNHQSSVRIIHGMGTGALRRAVRKFLADSPYCDSFNEAARAEGGGGVTIVELAS